MAPKKKSQKQNKNKSNKPVPNSSSSSSSGPKLQISAENESRLRRLLLNTSRPAQPAATPAQDSLSKAQKAKKLKAVYEKLSCEGFTNDQIELALSLLKDDATFETALDWLCLNLPGNELPLKFSSGTTQIDGGASVGVISVARKDWTPSACTSNEAKDEVPPIAVRVKGRHDEDALDSFQRSQADWIRQYMEQQEEDDYDSWEDHIEGNNYTKEVSKPRSSDVIAREYHTARLEATIAKERKDKKGQERAGNIIRKLKQEMSALGLSDDILALDVGLECASEETGNCSMPCEEIFVEDMCGGQDFTLQADESIMGGNCSSKESPCEPMPSGVPVQEKSGEESGEVELGNFFFEDATEALPPEVLEIQKKEKMRELYSEKNLEKLDGIWKKVNNF